ncbi:FG-GAP repeat domain-containing protein [Brevirhabdus sp.]|uniref:FG-GAP repeat domain-containing protein n=1 Tax=Brevirhabdus sp. TaxID=2004514 RepID=UPI0040589F2A
MRRLVVLAMLVQAVGGGALAAADGGAVAGTLAVTAAEYGQPTTRYAHGVLGDDIEFGSLVMTLSDGTRREVVLPENRVFEDVAPRVVDADGDGIPEVMVIETDVKRGAQLAIYGPAGKIAATPNIGRSNRWLAPVGVADLDGDGRLEIAFVDRPHLAKLLRIFRLEDGALNFVAESPGYSNHRIGESQIGGGIRSCGTAKNPNIRPEMVLATSDWRKVVAVRFDGRAFHARDLAPYEGPQTLAAAMSCD